MVTIGYYTVLGLLLQRQCWSPQTLLNALKIGINSWQAALGSSPFQCCLNGILPRWYIETINLTHWVHWQQQALWSAPKTGMDLEQEQEPVSDQLR